MPRSLDFTKAKNCAYRLIKFRLRSEKEIRDKLKEKKFSPVIIGEVVDFLKKTGLVDDVLFARLWIQGRISRSIGLRRLRFELKKKGIEKDIVEKTLGNIGEQYREEDVIQEVIALRLKKMRFRDPAKIKSSLYGFLLRRGFPQDKVYDALCKALKPVREENLDS
jgi:regulatory protein